MPIFTSSDKVLNCDCRCDCDYNCVMFSILRKITASDLTINIAASIAVVGHNLKPWSVVAIMNEYTVLIGKIYPGHNMEEWAFDGDRL